MDGMERASVETGAMVYGFCDLLRIHHRDIREQDHALECVGLYRPAFSVDGADLSSFYNYIFRTVCRGNPFKRISAVFSVRGEETGISCVMTSLTRRRIMNLNGFPFLFSAVEVNSQKCYNTSAENLSVYLWKRQGTDIVKEYECG